MGFIDRYYIINNIINGIVNVTELPISIFFISLTSGIIILGLSVWLYANIKISTKNDTINMLFIFCTTKKFMPYII